MSKNEIEAKIEYQVVIGDTKPGGYKTIRFTKVKYKASPSAHIDIRQFQRGFDEEGAEIYYPTKLGFRFPEREFRQVVEKYALMPETYVHPLIVKKCFSLLNSGQFESAVLLAFKMIEIQIREALVADSDEVGVKLIRRAFNSDNGPLVDMNLPRAERDAFCNYIAGAFGFYKNSCSHRDVDMDFVSAFERIVVASDLLKVVEHARMKDN